MTKARPKARKAPKPTGRPALQGRQPRAKTRASATKKSPLTKATTAVGRALGRTVTGVAERVPWGARPLDAIELLETDHRRLEDLLKRGDATTPRAAKGRAELLDTLTAELNAHELIEEQLLYPALKPHSEAKEIVLEGYQEHHVADVLVSELHALATSDERWGAKFSVLKENIEHHIEEEEGEMFKTARSVLSRSELEELGARMEAMKAKALRR